MVGFLLFFLPMPLLFALQVVPELPGLWPHLPIWLAFALLGWWGFRPGVGTARAAGIAVLVVALVASWYAAARVPAAISAALSALPVDRVTRRRPRASSSGNGRAEEAP